MDTNKNLFWNKAMFWGFIIALASMLATTVYYTSDSMLSKSKSWVEMAIYTIGIVLCAIAYKKTLTENDEFPYSKALGLGVATAFFASLILAIFTYVLYKFIDSSLMDEILLNAEEVLLESGFSDDMIEKQLEMQQKFVTPAFLTITTIFSVVLTGLIISLITSIFVRKPVADGFKAAMNEIDDED